MNSRLRQLAALTSGLVLTLGVSACSGDDGSTTKGSSSPTSSAPAGSSDSGDDSQAAFFQKITAAQVKASTSHVSMTIDAAGQAITAEGDVQVGKTAADTAMSMTMDLGAATGAGKLSMRLVDKAFYLNFGQVTDNKFAKVDLDDKSNPIAQQFGSITEQLDPSKQLEQFSDALTSFTKKGDVQKIDGVDAQPYELVLDTSKIAGMGDLPSGAGASLPKTLTYTMFIGPDDLLRRVTADVAGSTITVDYTKWGQDVDVKAPSADEISDTDLSQLSGS